MENSFNTTYDYKNEDKISNRKVSDSSNGLQTTDHFILSRKPYRKLNN